MTKYEPLKEHLEQSRQAQVRLRFSEIERILGTPLPASARKYSAWWANEADGTTHTHARSWLGAGYETRHLDLNGQSVEFVRATQ